MILRQEFVWHSTDEGDFPTTGGTKACLYLGEACWLYWNPDSQTWHSINGWRRKIGHPKTDVTLWCEIPRAPIPDNDFF